MNEKNRPLLIIVSAPSGAGKTTLCDAIREQSDRLVYSVSCTTRAPRSNEIDGVHYHFLSDEQFESRVEQGAFLEHAEVHGAWYGTLRETVAHAMHQGHDVLMDIDVQGADKIRQALADAPEHDLLRRGYVDIFVSPPSVASLRQRLAGRAQDAPEVIERRVQNAEYEMTRSDAYQYLLINDDLPRAIEIMQSIITAEHHRNV